MTEEEAKTKWCPFARVSADVTQNGAHVAITPSFNRRTTQDHPSGAMVAGSLCVGSACMAWRTHEVTEHAEGSRFTTTHGYCGLAGRT